MNEWEWRLLEDRPAIDSVAVPGGELRVGTRVRIRPHKPGGDAMDLVLAGRTALVESLEEDYEGGVQAAVVLDDDPGRDLGLMRLPGHRFFYRPEELEPCSPPPQILIAGIGNIFLGDDGFGVEVAQRLLARELPAGVRVVDFGIRSLDLAYALSDAPGPAILVDACPRGEAPGTLFVIEPDLEDAGAEPSQAPLDAHAMNPAHVIRMAKSMNGRLHQILVLGCEPATLGPDEGQLGLSDQVSAVIDDAAELALTLARRIHEGDRGGFDDGKV